MAGHLERYGWDNSYFPRLAYVPADEPNSGDTTYVVNKSGSTYTWTPESTSTAHRTLEWEWNGADVSQFESAEDFNGSTGTSMTGLSLSTVADTDLPGGLKLRFTASGAGTGYAVAHWLVKTSEISFTWPSTYEIEYVLKDAYPTYGGFSFFGDASTDHYYAWNCLSANGTRHRVDAGTVVDFMSGATNNNLLSGSNLSRGVVRIWGDHESGLGPRFVISGHGLTGTALTRILDETNGSWQTAGTVAPASWQGKTTNRFGLSLVSISGGGTGNLDLASLKIFKLGTGL